MLKDHRKEEAEYFRRTQVIPVIHTLVLQEELVAKQPWIVESLLAAFRKARALEDKYMTEEERDEARWLSEVIGYDPFAYSFDASTRKSLAALIRCQMQQGLAQSRARLWKNCFFANVDRLDSGSHRAMGASHETQTLRILLVAIVFGFHCSLLLAPALSPRRGPQRNGNASWQRQIKKANSSPASRPAPN